MRACPRCKALKPVSEFHGRPDGTGCKPLCCDCMPHVLRTCPGCGAAFWLHARGQIYCDRWCSKAGKQAAARARKAGATRVELIHPLEIHTRDHWACKLCGGPTRQSLFRQPIDRRDPDAPTLDHIVPLLFGGTHTRDNLQTAHFACNLRKGERDIHWARTLGNFAVR